MEYKYIEKDDYDKKIRDKFGDEWSYYSKSAAKELLNSCEVIGDIDFNRQSVHGKILQKDDNILSFNDVHKLNPLTMSVDGYMVANEDEPVLLRVVKKNNRMPILLVTLILIATASGVFWWMNRDSGPVLEDEAIAYKMPEGVPANTDPNKIALPGYGDLTIQAGTDELYAALVNPEGNQCYFKYRVILKDGNKVLYESNLIKPGMAVTNVKLNQKIERGTYDMQLVVLTYSLDDYKNQLNGGVIETKLIAK